MQGRLGHSALSPCELPPSLALDQHQTDPFTAPWDIQPLQATDGQVNKTVGQANSSRGYCFELSNIWGEWCVLRSAHCCLPVVWVTGPRRHHPAADTGHSSISYLKYTSLPSQLSDTTLITREERGRPWLTSNESIDTEHDHLLVFLYLILPLFPLIEWYRQKENNVINMRYFSFLIL